MLVRLFVMILASSKVPGIFGWGVPIENGRIITAVKINIGFDKEMIGKHAASVSQQYFHNVILSPLAPMEDTRLQHRRHAERAGSQQQQNEKRHLGFHTFNALRRNTSQVANRSVAE